MFFIIALYFKYIFAVFIILPLERSAIGLNKSIVLYQEYKKKKKNNFYPFYG